MGNVRSTKPGEIPRGHEMSRGGCADLALVLVMEMRYSVATAQREDPAADEATGSGARNAPQLITSTSMSKAILNFTPRRI
jgi:hypothetical protein